MIEADAERQVELVAYPSRASRPAASAAAAAGDDESFTVGGGGGGGGGWGRMRSWRFSGRSTS